MLGRAGVSVDGSGSSDSALHSIHGSAMRAARAHGVSTAASSGVDNAARIAGSVVVACSSALGSSARDTVTCGGASAGSGNDPTSAGVGSRSTTSGPGSVAAGDGRVVRRPPASGRDRPRCEAARARGGGDAASTRAPRAASSRSTEAHEQRAQCDHRHSLLRPRAHPAPENGGPASSAGVPGELPAHANLASRPLRARTRCTACYRSSTRERKGVDDDLAKIAAAYGVATAYRDGDRRPVTVDPEAVMRVLGLLDVDAGSPQARRIALAGARERTPATVAARPDEPRPLPRPACSSTRRAPGGRHGDPRGPRPRLVPAGNRRPAR